MREKKNSQKNSAMKIPVISTRLTEVTFHRRKRHLLRRATQREARGNAT